MGPLCINRRCGGVRSAAAGDVPLGLGGTAGTRALGLRLVGLAVRASGGHNCDTGWARRAWPTLGGDLLTAIDLSRGLG